MPVRWVMKSFRFYLSRILGEHKENERLTENSSEHFAESIIWEENKLTRVLVKAWRSKTAEKSVRTPRCSREKAKAPEK